MPAGQKEQKIQEGYELSDGLKVPEILLVHKVHHVAYKFLRPVSTSTTKRPSIGGAGGIDDAR